LGFRAEKGVDYTVEETVTIHLDYLQEKRHVFTDRGETEGQVKSVREFKMLLENLFLDGKIIV
jgi:hypothetical protein